MKNAILLLSAAICLAGCLPEDERVTPHAPGEVRTGEVSMSADYRYQVYFDLGTGEAVASNLKTAWDLAFASGADGAEVFLNSGRAMCAASTGRFDFADVTDTAGLVFRWDHPAGDPARSAIGEWGAARGEVYVIDLGYDWQGRHLGFRKLALDSVDAGAYRFRAAKLGEARGTAFLLEKRVGYNHVHYSFDGGAVPGIEPPAGAWDLHFTQYVDGLFDGTDTIPYLVTGVLTNPNGVEAALDSVTPFANVDYGHVQKADFEDRSDVIGYGWKYYDLNGGTYTVDLTKVYLIRDTEGYFFKLRFVDFYDDMGMKGTPVFEYQGL